jgi:ubiquinone/menaquinone biosynthesis C-methylase UbiE
VKTSEYLVGRVVAQMGLDRLELLDVACGSGDIPLALADRFRRQGVSLHLTLLDRSAAHLPLLPEAIVGDALDLPFPPCSFDVVSCALFLHHLEPATIKRFVQEALRVARAALVINDLLRNWAHLALVSLGRPLFRSRMAWQDGVVSVRRAYTEAELRALLAGAGSRVEFSRHYLQRIGVIVWK